MDKKSWVAALALAVPLAYGQTFRPAPGAKEFGLAGNWSSASGNGSALATVDFGYYFTRNLVAVTSGTFGRTDGVNSSLWLIGVRYEFNSSGDFVPYLSAGFYFRDSGGDRSSTDRGGVGANYYLRKNMAVYAEASFFRFGRSTRDTTTSVDVGVRFFFK